MRYRRTTRRRSPPFCHAVDSAAVVPATALPGRALSAAEAFQRVFEQGTRLSARGASQPGMAVQPRHRQEREPATVLPGGRHA